MNANASDIVGVPDALPPQIEALLEHWRNLGVFLAVDLALWRIKLRKKSRPTGFVVPGWVPPLAATAALGLMLAEFVE